MSTSAHSINDAKGIEDLGWRWKGLKKRWHKLMKKKWGKWMLGFVVVMVSILLAGGIWVMALVVTQTNNDDRTGAYGGYCANGYGCGVIGFVDEVRSRDCAIGGWTLDTNAQDKQLEVEFYVDGRKVKTGVAKRQRDDIYELTGVPGPHGFDVSLKDKLEEGKVYKVRVKAIAAEGSPSEDEFLIKPVIGDPITKFDMRCGDEADSPSGSDSDGDQGGSGGNDEDQAGISDGWAAGFVSQNLESTRMVAGSKQTVVMKFKNTGSQDWTRASGVKLGLTEPRDSGVFGISRVWLVEGEVIRPGQTKTFSFDIQAPAENTSMRWQMVKDGQGGSWFGAMSDAVTIELVGTDDDRSVSPKPKPDPDPDPTPVSPQPNDNQLQSEYVGQEYITTMSPGSTQLVAMRFKNTGEETWVGSGNTPVRVGVGDPRDSWILGGPARADLNGQVVNPGEVAVFTYLVKAPSTPGSYTVKWQMIKEKVKWFGEMGQPMTIRVE